MIRDLYFFIIKRALICLSEAETKKRSAYGSSETEGIKVVALPKGQGQQL